MAEKSPVVSTADEVRKILAGAKAPITAKQIFDQCDTATETTQVATILHKEVQDGRAVRTGTRGAYTYAITADGRGAAENPNSLRSRAHRRVRGRGPRKTAALSKVTAAKARPAKSPGKRRGRPPGSGRATATPKQPADARNDDSAMRLAGAVLTHWPTPLKSMPAELRECVERTLQAGGAS